MRIYNQRINRYQRIASLMIIVLLVSSLTCNVPTVYAAEEVAEPFSINYTEEKYSVTAEVSEVWNNGYETYGYNIRITINNTSDETIHNWGIMFGTKDEIHDLYNAQVLSDEDGVYLLRNSVYNQDIPAGGNVTFGYTGYSAGEMDVPEEYAVSSIETAVESEGFLVSYILCDSWDSGAIAQILIENTSDKTIEDWILEFDSKIEITQIWDAELVSHEGEHYVIRNVPYAHNIMAGSTAVVGLHLLEAPVTDEEDILTNVIVREILPDGSGQGNGGENDPSVSDNDVSGNVVPDEDIVHLEMEEGLGEIYYKTAYEDDVVSDPMGLPCIKNQFLLSADDTVDFWYVESYLSELGAEIVGYIEVINNYQVEMIEDTDVEAIQELTERISNEAWVSYAGFNYLWLEEPDFHTTDPWSTVHGDEREWEFNTATPSGNNWGFEAIDFEGALINAGVISSSQDAPEDIRTDHLTTVRMGIIDSAFDEWHDDLSANFVMTWQNYTELKELRDAYLDALYNGDGYSEIAHGTHVVGIMCAVFNNREGITGVCIKNEIYGCARNIIVNDTPVIPPKKVEIMTFVIACDFSALITNDVKVINYSQGLNKGIVYAASVEPESERGRSAIQYLNIQSFYIKGVLDKLLEQGYDFLIVTAAGNGNDKEFYQCDIKAPYVGGYISVEEARRKGIRDVYVDFSTIYEANGQMNARYNSVFNYIPETSLCYEHIICVGSFGLTDTGEYNISTFSNIGNRIDLYAPGEDIFSTYPTGCAFHEYSGIYIAVNYDVMSGTSMAAPFVSGTAGLAYNVNPDLSAAELKDIIINNASILRKYRILNAANVIAAVTDAGDVDKETDYTVSLHVTDTDGNNVPGAQIEIRDFSAYFFKLLGAIFALPVAGNQVICGDIITDQSGIAGLDLQEGNYYAVIKDDNGAGGVIYNFQVESRDIENQTAYEVILEPMNNNESCALVLQFKDAGNNSIIDDVTVRLYRGWDEDKELYVKDDGIYEISTDKEGNITIAFIPKGAYTVEIYRNGDIVGYSNVVVVGPSNDRIYYAYRL